MEEKKVSIKILIADDHSMVREGFRQLLQLEDEFEVVGEAANGEAALELINELQPDVILLDINMPKKNGLEVLEVLRVLSPSPCGHPHRPLVRLVLLVRL